MQLESDPYVDRPPVRPLRLAVVQPVMSPVRRPLFELLAKHQDVVLKVFVLSNTLPQRPRWSLREREDFDFELVGSKAQPVRRRTPGQRDINGVRLLPTGLLPAIRRWRPDVTVCGNLTELLSLLPLRLAGRLPIVLVVADTKVTVSQYPQWHQYLRGKVYRHADTFVPYGNSAIAYLRSLDIPEDRMFHGMWSVDARLYERTSRDLRQDGTARHRWITVGQLVPRKGYNELLDAWAAQDPQFRERNSLWIVGEGPERANLEARVARLGLRPSVSLLGHKSADELAALYEQSDAFVLPTLMDHWGLVVNEAMASGLPVLCSRYAGCHMDLVQPGSGALFDPLDRAGFAATLNAFWGTRDRWQEMGATSRRIVSRYSLHATADALADAARAATGHQPQAGPEPLGQTR
jgi:glycosyltransferase involved in cell wall biosynthesis